MGVKKRAVGAEPGPEADVRHRSEHDHRLTTACVLIFLNFLIFCGSRFEASLTSTTCSNMHKKPWGLCGRFLSKGSRDGRGTQYLLSRDELWAAESGAGPWAVGCGLVKGTTNKLASRKTKSGVAVGRFALQSATCSPGIVEWPVRTSRLHVKERRQDPRRGGKAQGLSALDDGIFSPVSRLSSCVTLRVSILTRQKKLPSPGKRIAGRTAIGNINHHFDNPLRQPTSTTQFDSPLRQPAATPAVPTHDLASGHRQQLGRPGIAPFSLASDQPHYTLPTGCIPHT